LAGPQALTPQPSDAVIRFEPDGYDLNSPRMLGRVSAGHGFLRAAVRGRGEGPVYGYTARPVSAQAFGRMVRDFDPAAEPAWIQGEQLDRIAETRGVLYVADPNLPAASRARLRVGSARYSLCGVTHTLSSLGAQQCVAELLTEAVMPWDALVCTSSAALQAVETILEAQADFLRWRFGPEIALRRPQLPVIPLGVNCDDFAFSAAQKARARRAIEIADDEMAALYVGRLVYTGKAHPFPAFLALQAAAERSGRKLVFILCGRAPDQAHEANYLAGAAAYAPDVRIVQLDSRDDAARRCAWAAGDIFISLADSVQETFGLTPVEAMAAGLPAVVSDYNGYRDTVRDGVDGFRIATLAPEPGLGGRAFALRHELGMLNNGEYYWMAASATSVDLRQLTERLTALVEQPELRRSLGAAGQARARALYDWPQIFGRYRALWGELNAARRAVTVDPDTFIWAARAPRQPPSRLDPFEAFGHYTTARIGRETRFALAPGVTPEIYRNRRDSQLFPQGHVPEPAVLAMWAELEAGPASVADLAVAAKLSPGWAAICLGALAKMGLVERDLAD
jgi:glycosyltransferase involved in cell wall biosynthesis